LVLIKKEVQTLQNRVIELERQLEQAQARIRTLTEGAKKPLRDSQLLEKTQLLELQQARLTAILENLPVGVWIADENGKLVGKNRQADRIWAGESPLLKSIEEYQQYIAWYPESGKLLQPKEYPVAIALRTGQPVKPVELKIRRFDGSEGTVLVSAAPVKDSQGQLLGVVGVNVDISDRQRVEEKRRLAEERYTTLFNAVREGFAHYKAMYDDQGKLADILVVEINPAGAKLSGVAREDQVGKTWRQVWPGVADELFAMYQHVDETGEILRFDDNNHLTGRIYDVVISKIAPGELIATFNDITERKQAEERLAYQAKLLSSVHHAVVATNEQMRITYWNEAAEEIFGWKAEEVLGQSTLELFQTKVPNSTREEAVKSLMETGRYEGEVLYRRKDGTYFTAYAWSAVLGSTQGGSKGLVTSVQDITQRKRAEEALQKSEERFNKAFHASPNALVISRQEDGRIETINDTFVRFFGYSEEEVIGKTSIELGMFANPVDLQEAVRRLQKDKSVRDFELDVQLKSGEIRNVSLSIEMIEIGGEHAMLTMIQDITERKQAEQALRESEQQLKRAEEIAHLGSWELDIVNNRLIWSDEVYRIFGLEPQEFGATYEAFLEAVHPDDRHAVDDAYSSSIREGRDAYEIEHRVVKRSSGEVRIVHEKCEHFRNHGGQIVRSTGMVHDITERKQAEEALLESERQLKRSNKDLQDFAFTASHELQEPLRKIEMFGELLQKWAPQLDEQGRDYIERMRNAAKRMRATVDGLLQLSRVATRGKPFVRVDLSQLISEVLSDLEDQIRRTNGRVDVGALPAVEGDPLQLRQLMQNLISNALKYHHPGTPPEVKVYTKQMSGQVQIFVEDKGIGFEQEEAEHIFQPFVRLVGRSQYEGSGMGLAICRRIVERHAGEITAHSKPGEGTTFLVTLPIHHAESARNE